MTPSPLTVQLKTIPSKEFTKEKLVGRGGFGSVYYGTWHRADVAIKELFAQATSELFTKEFYHEAQMMAQSQHPNIARLFGVCLEDGKLALIMEYLHKGSLYTNLQDVSTSLSWSKRYDFAIDIIKGLAYLHRNHVIHRDLKSLNILIAKDDTAKITDFGLAKVKLETSTKTSGSGPVQGSVRWMAPELFVPKAQANKASDIYSFGMILLEMATRKVPYSEATNDAVVIAWKMNNYQEDLPTDCDEDYKHMIIKCCKAAAKRPTAEELSQELNLLCEKTKTVRQSVLQNLPNQEEDFYLSNTLADIRLSAAKELNLPPEKTSSLSQLISQKPPHQEQIVDTYHSNILSSIGLPIPVQMHPLHPAYSHSVDKLIAPPLKKQSLFDDNDTDDLFKPPLPPEDKPPPLPPRSLFENDRISQWKDPLNPNKKTSAKNLFDDPADA